MANNKKGFAPYLRMVLTLFVICAVTAGVVAGVNALTYQKIAENLESEIRESIETMFGEGVEYTTLSDIPATAEAIYEIVRNGEKSYCVNLNSSGFGGDINMLVGVAQDGTLIGVSVVSHSETPGLGSRATESPFIDGFVGKKNTSEVDAIAGATITSSAVKQGAKDAQEILLSIGLIEFESQEADGQ
ncbi:MAG: FMN-binding protein [Clostridia bacterium]|nr:FMN-binding protein [Clostridia bacterium]